MVFRIHSLGKANGHACQSVERLKVLYRPAGLTTMGISLPEDGEQIYKRYQYLNGEVLTLTKKEFDHVVELFKMLDEQSRKLERLREQRCSSNITPSLLKNDI